MVSDLLIGPVVARREGNLLGRGLWRKYTAQERRRRESSCCVDGSSRGCADHSLGSY
jgi:hypothetical protein